MHRYHVTFTSVDGDPYSYRVATAMGTEKAVAVAAARHGGNDGPVKRRIYGVQVEDLGELDVDPGGVYVICDDDLSDRMEW